MSIILSLAGDRISDDCLARQGYRQVARISGKEVVRIFGTRSHGETGVSSHGGHEVRVPVRGGNSIRPAA
jgi:hypothetical protein